jgi:hypothetical protein
LEQHPDVRDFIAERLAAQPIRSIREAKRLLNVWQVYQRVLAATDPIAETRASLARARHLVILAEVVTRWPGLQRQLHQRFNGQRGLQLLAKAVEDDTAWLETVELLWPEAPAQRTQLANLRTLLRFYDGLAVSELAAAVF